MMNMKLLQSSNSTLAFLLFQSSYRIWLVDLVIRRFNVVAEYRFVIWMVASILTLSDLVKRGAL